MTILKRHIEVEIRKTISSTPESIINKFNPLLENAQIFCSFQCTKQVSTDIPTECFIDFYNLSPRNIGLLDYKKRLTSSDTGVILTIKAGYRSKGLKHVFTGVVVSASTRKERANYITRVQLRSGFFDLFKKNVDYAVAKGESKKQVLIKVLENVGLKLASGFESYLNVSLLGQEYKEEEEISEPLNVFLKRFKKSNAKNISFSFDDIAGGASVSTEVSPFFVGTINPLGSSFLVSSSNADLINSPEITNRGANLEIQLKPEVKIGDKILVESKVLARLATGTGISPSKFQRLTPVRIEHVCDNRDGPFITRLECYFYEPSVIGL